MDRPEEIDPADLPGADSAEYEVTDEMLTAQPNEEFECTLTAYDNCEAIGVIEVPAEADASVTGATLFTFDAVGTQFDAGFIKEGTEVPLYLQSGGYYATYDGLCPVWVSSEFVTITSGVEELATAINQSDWSADSECGGGSSDESPALGGGALPVLAMTEGTSTEHGWVITITLQSGDVSGLTFGIEDIPIGPASEVLPFIIYDGLVLPSGRVINAGESLGAKLYPVASLAEGQYAELDAQGQIVHGPAFFVKP